MFLNKKLTLSPPGVPGACRDEAEAATDRGCTVGARCNAVQLLRSTSTSRVGRRHLGPARPCYIHVRNKCIANKQICLNNGYAL